eukprot:s303_g35.t1
MDSKDLNSSVHVITQSYLTVLFFFLLLSHWPQDTTADQLFVETFQHRLVDAQGEDSRRQVALLRRIGFLSIDCLGCLGAGHETSADRASLCAEAAHETCDENICATT